MTTNNLSLKRVVLIIVTGIGLLSSRMLFAEISDTELLNIIRQKDEASKYIGYKISFVDTVPSAKDPKQGFVRIDCEFTHTDGGFAMKKIFNYEHPPVFIPPGTPYYQSFDYDDKGRLIVWRPLKMYVFSNAEKNDLFEERAIFFVDPNGRVASGACGPALQRYPIDKPYNMHQFQSYKFAMGFGFSKHLGTISSANTLPTGQMKVISRGSYGSALPGTWELTIDSDSDNIVRNAVFKTDFLNRPSLVVTTSGIITKDEIKLAKHGTFRHVGSGFETNIEVTNISKVIGSNTLYEEVVNKINAPLPPGAQIADCRTKETIITTVE